MENVVSQGHPDQRENQDFKDYPDCLEIKEIGVTRDHKELKELAAPTE